MAEELENPLTKIAEAFHKERLAHDIGYVLEHSEEIVRKNCHYDLDNSKYRHFYNLALAKFKNKYEPRYKREMETKLYQAFESYKGTCGLQYVFKNFKIIGNKITKNKIDNPLIKESYKKVMNKFKEKYEKKIFGNKVNEKPKKTIFGLSPLMAIWAIICGIIEAIDKASRYK